MNNADLINFYIIFCTTYSKNLQKTQKTKTLSYFILIFYKYYILEEQ